jgi:hypothetical protein
VGEHAPDANFGDSIGRDYDGRDVFQHAGDGVRGYRARLGRVGDPRLQRMRNRCLDRLTIVNRRRRLPHRL